MLPSRKTYVILILCVGVVVSTWFIFGPQAKTPSGNQNANTASVVSSQNTVIDSNTDWKKILVEATSQPITDLTADNSGDSGPFDDTTLTAQMAKDFFAQYLLLAKDRTPVTPEEANAVAERVISSPNYSQLEHIPYTKKNLNITANTDAETVKKYRDALEQSFNKRFLKKSVSPLLIVSDALEKNTPQDLSKLNPVIETSKGIISDLLAMEVPSDAVTIHLSLLNSYQSGLESLVAMKNIMNDPVKSLLSANQYNQSVTSYTTAIVQIDAYFKAKL